MKTLPACLPCLPCLLLLHPISLDQTESRVRCGPFAQEIRGLDISDCHYLHVNFQTANPPPSLLTNALVAQLSRLAVAGGLVELIRVITEPGMYPNGTSKRVYDTIIRDCTVTATGYGDITGGAFAVVDADAYVMRPHLPHSADGTTQLTRYMMTWQVHGERSGH